MVGVHDPHDPNSSDHVVAVTQLKEKIAHLQKQISIKDGQLLAKDRQVSIKKKKKRNNNNNLKYIHIITILYIIIFCFLRLQN